MTIAFSETDVAISLMKEALTLLDAPEVASAARLLQLAIDSAAQSSTFSNETHDVLEGGE